MKKMKYETFLKIKKENYFLEGRFKTILIRCWDFYLPLSLLFQHQQFRVLRFS
jgi:hypothetical protein